MRGDGQRKFNFVAWQHGCKIIVIPAHDSSDSQNSMHVSVSGAVGLSEQVKLKMLPLIFWECVNANVNI